MKIKDATNKVNKALDGAAAKVERSRLTKWILVALAVVLVLLVFAWAKAAHATGLEHAVVVTTVVKAAPAAVTAAAPAAATSGAASGGGAAPVVAGGGGSSLAGTVAFAGVGVFFWAVICVAEKAKNPNGFWAKYLCLRAEPRT